MRRNIVPMGIKTAIAIAAILAGLSGPALSPAEEDRPSAGKPASPEGIKVKPERPRFQLLGIQLSPDPTGSTALIQDSIAYSQRLYQKGDQVGDATLVEIKAGEAVLDQEGKRQVLRLASAVPPGSARAEDEFFSLNFDNADIRAVIALFSRITAKNFILDDNVRGTVTMIGSERIPSGQALELLASILEMKGFGMVPAGDFIKVMSKRDASRGAIPLETGNQAAERSGTELISRRVPLRYLSAEAVMPVIGKSLSRDALVTTEYSSNSLVITDTRENVDRLAQTIEEIDRPGLATSIRALIKTVSEKTGRNFIIADEVTGNAGLLTPTPLEGVDGLDSLKQVLETCGYRMEDNGRFIVVTRAPGERIKNASPGCHPAEARPSRPDQPGRRRAAEPPPPETAEP